MKKNFALILLCFILVSCNKTENKEITDVPKTIQENIVEYTALSNTGEIVENGSGENIENTIDYSEITNSAKIYDAYISEEKVEIGKNENIGELNNTLIKTLKRVKGTNYFIDDKNVYSFFWVGIEKVEGLYPKEIKGLIPYESFNGSSTGMTFSNFATNGKNLFYYGEKIENGDINSLKFRKIGDNFISGDKNNLYLGNKNFIKGGDLFTFIGLGKNGWYFKDKNFVYISGGIKVEILKGADSNTFEIIDENLQYSKDKNSVYKFGEKLEGIDPKTFDLEKYLKDKGYSKIVENGSGEKINTVVFSDKLSEIGERYQIENNINKKEYKIIGESIYFIKGNDIYCLDLIDLIKLDGLTKDSLKGANNVFLSIGDDLYYKCQKVENGNINTLKYKKIGDEYVAGDKNNLYVGFKEIFEGGDIYTYTKLGKNTGYSKDKKFVYFQPAMQTIIIKGADPTSFEIIDENLQYSKDKNSVYKFGEKLEGVDPKTFDLEKYLKEKGYSN